MEEIRRARVYRLRLAELMACEIDDVNELFDHLAAGLRTFAPPVRMQRVAMELAGEQARAPGLPALRSGVPALHGCPEAIHEATRSDDASLCSRIDHRPRACHIQRNRFLHQHVRSRSNCLLDLTAMCERRKRDDQQIDLRIQHAKQIAE